MGKYYKNCCRRVVACNYMRKLRTPSLDAGESTFIGLAFTAEGASQTDLVGKRHYDSRVGA